MISNEFLEEIIEISKQRKLIDQTFVCKFVEELISNADEITQNIFSYFGFCNNKDFLGKTNPDSGVILLSLDECYKNANMLKIPMLEKNILILNTILHEFEHLKEYSKEKKNGIEGKLIYISNFANSYADSKTNIYRYYINPSEKIAEAQSWKELLKIVKQYPNFISNYEGTYNFINNMYINRLKQGYEKKENGNYNIPIFDFLRLINRLSLANEIFKLVPSEEKNNVGKFSLEKRFMYGFKINHEEMKELNKKKLIIKR